MVVQLGVQGLNDYFLLRIRDLQIQLFFFERLELVVFLFKFSPELVDGFVEKRVAFGPEVRRKFFFYFNDRFLFNDPLLADGRGTLLRVVANHIH